MEKVKTVHLSQSSSRPVVQWSSRPICPFHLSFSNLSVDWISHQNMVSETRKGWLIFLNHHWCFGFMVSRFHDFKVIARIYISTPVPIPDMRDDRLFVLLPL